MIEIKVDKTSELMWLQSILGAGTCNLSHPYTLKYLGVKLNQNITFKKSDSYENDIKEKMDEYNKRFPDNRIPMMKAERILREELLGERRNDTVQTTKES